MFWLVILVSGENIEYSQAARKRCSEKAWNYNKNMEIDPREKLLFWKNQLCKYCEPVAKILENKHFIFHRHFFF